MPPPANGLVSCSSFANAAVVAMAQQQRMGGRIADRADADLQRAAVAHQPRHVQTDRLFGQADRPLDRGEQLEPATGAVEQAVDLVLADLRRLAGHERQRGIRFAGEQKPDLAAAARGEQVER